MSTRICKRAGCPSLLTRPEGNKAWATLCPKHRPKQNAARDVRRAIANGQEETAKELARAQGMLRSKGGPLDRAAEFAAVWALTNDPDLAAVELQLSKSKQAEAVDLVERVEVLRNIRDRKAGAAIAYSNAVQARLLARVAAEGRTLTGAQAAGAAQQLAKLNDLHAGQGGQRWTAVTINVPGLTDEDRDNEGNSDNDEDPPARD